MFLFGMAINIHSDAVLRNLRKPNETGYKTPKGTEQNLTTTNFMNCLFFKVAFLNLCLVPITLERPWSGGVIV